MSKLNWSNARVLLQHDIAVDLTDAMVKARIKRIGGVEASLKPTSPTPTPSASGRSSRRSEFVTAPSVSEGGPAGGQCRSAGSRLPRM